MPNAQTLAQGARRDQAGKQAREEKAQQAVLAALAALAGKQPPVAQQDRPLQGEPGEPRPSPTLVLIADLISIRIPIRATTVGALVAWDLPLRRVVWQPYSQPSPLSH
jgi:hypothetical protein